MHLLPAFTSPVPVQCRVSSPSFRPFASCRPIRATLLIHDHRRRPPLTDLAISAASRSRPVCSARREHAVLQSPKEPTSFRAPAPQVEHSFTFVLRRLLHFSFTEPSVCIRLLIAIFCMLLSKLILISVPFLFKSILETLTFPRVASKTIPLLLVAYFAAKVSVAVFHGLRNAIFARAGQRLGRYLARDAFVVLHTLGAAWYTSIATGSVIRIVGRGILSVLIIFRLLVFSFVPSIFELVLVSAVMLGKGWWGTMAVVVTVFVVYLWWTFSATEELMNKWGVVTTASNDCSGKITDSLINYETVSIFDNADFETRRYDACLKSVEDASIMAYWKHALLNTGQGLIFAAGLTSVLFMAAAAFLSEIKTVGDVVVVATMLEQLWLPLGSVGLQYRQLRRSFVDVQNLFRIVATGPTVKELEGAKPLRVTKGEIVFERVSFSYPQTGAQSTSFAPDSVKEQLTRNSNRDTEEEDVKKQTAVLRDLTFRVPPGKTFAIVGESGSGKSTVLRLLYRLYDINGGRILIDGQDISQVSLSSLRGSIAIVPQDISLFNDTVTYNIEYGHPEAPLREVIAAAKAASIHESILSMKDGYDTFCGERGVRLSGGERQRLSAARAILKNCKIVLQDEATSALDSATEAEVATALKTVGKSKTNLIIAHRLSTIFDADWILVLNEGVVVEEGTHESLLKIKDGLYKDMWECQQGST